MRNTSNTPSTAVDPDPSRAEEIGRGGAGHGFETEIVGGVPIVITAFSAAVEWLHQRTVRHLGAIDVRLVNAYSIVTVNTSAPYLDLMRTSGVSFPDGAPVVAALRYLRGRRDAGRVRGPSFFRASLDRAAGTGVGEFFLGTTDATLERLSAATRELWPSVRVVGTWAPPFQAAMDDTLIEACKQRVARSGADRVWVALGTPKQDYVAQRLAQELDLPCIAVGAAFDFLAGTKREAPRLFQKLGIEWVFRFLSEPRRLWRRYLVGNLTFVWLVLRKHR